MLADHSGSMLYRSLLSESPTGLNVYIADGSDTVRRAESRTNVFPTTTQQQILLKYFVETSDR